MKDFKNDFHDFLSSQGKSTPKALDQKILNYVHAELNPGHIKVFLKLIMIQTFVGLLTLFFCPQFNLSFTNNHEVYHYFHYNFGEKICMFICGSIFVGSGAIFAANLMNKPEIKKVQSSKLLYYFSLTSLFLTTFLILGSDIYLKILSFWIAGAVLSGITLLETSLYVRKKMQAY